MAVSARTYGRAALAAVTGALPDLRAATLKCALATSAYTPNVDSHEFFSSVTGEVTGAGYTAGGQTLTGVTATYDAANHRAVVAADSPTWVGASFTARYAVVYIATGDPTTSRLLSWVDFGVDRTESAIDFVISFHTGGLIRLNV